MLRTAREIVVATVAVLGVFACSGGGGALDSSSSSGGGGGGPVNPGQCQSACARIVSCKEKTEGLCTATQDCGSLIGYLQPDFRDAYLGCIADPATACKDLEKCVAVGAAKTATNSEGTAFMNACNDKRKGCTPSFSDDSCAEGPFYNSAALAKLNACLSLGCADISKCLKSAVVQ